MTLLEHRSFVAVIANLVTPVAAEISQIAGQVKIRFSQLVVFQEFQHFKGPANWTTLILSLCRLLSINFALNVKRVCDFIFGSFWLIITIAYCIILALLHQDPLH